MSKRLDIFAILAAAVFCTTAASAIERTNQYAGEINYLNQFNSEGTIYPYIVTSGNKIFVSDLKLGSDQTKVGKTQFSAMSFDRNTGGSSCKNVSVHYTYGGWTDHFRFCASVSVVDRNNFQVNTDISGTRRDNMRGPAGKNHARYYTVDKLNYYISITDNACQIKPISYFASAETGGQTGSANYTSFVSTKCEINEK